MGYMGILFLHTHSHILSTKGGLCGLYIAITSSLHPNPANAHPEGVDGHCLATRNPHMSYSLNSLEWGYTGACRGGYYGVNKGDTRNLD